MMIADRLNLAQRDFFMNFFSKHLSLPKATVTFLGILGLSVPAFADVAARVTFVTGQVSVIDSNNNKRSVFKGDLIHGGEKIETANGRIQVRMTDGGIIVLRPNSLFEITRYNFSKDTPELGTVLFNFIKGGARALSGAIGKANRLNYQFKTPVATIGIRGTDYSTSLTDDGTLTVTVTDGKVNISNVTGESDANEGESYLVTNGNSPALCYNTNAASKKAVDETCEPVIIPLEAEEGIALSKQKVKKPALEDFASYGAFIEAVRRYKSFEDDIFTSNNINSPNASSQTDSPKDASLANANKEALKKSILNAFLKRVSVLDVQEMGDVSVNNTLGFQPTNIPSLLEHINEKDQVAKMVFKYKISDEETEELKSLNASLLSSIPLELSIFKEENFTLFGNETNVLGLDIGTPEVEVSLNNSPSETLGFKIFSGARNGEWLTDKGISSTSLSNVDKNGNGIFRGVSLRQATMHDNDGMDGSRNSGSIVLGDGSEAQATAIYMDDNIPVSVGVSVDHNTSNALSGKSSAIVLNVSTPKIFVKTGDVYVSNSNLAAEGITKDGARNAGSSRVLGTNQDGATPVRIMGGSEIILGEAQINAQVRVNRDSQMQLANADGLAYSSPMSILVNANIKEGLTINNLDLIDAGGPIQGGHLRVENINIRDNGGLNLKAKLSINIENFSRTSLDGLGIYIDSIGDVQNGIDMALNGIRLGDFNAPSIGDIEIVGMKLNGTILSIRGH